MADSIADFERKHDYLVCVDSDGCAMDTMDIKHIRCFGPCMVDEWDLNEWRTPILERWNEINLYTMSRGINRYKGLAQALAEINEQYTPIEDLDALTTWAADAPELSNPALEQKIAENNAKGEAHVSLEKALAWSKAVNRSITELPEEEKKPFEGVAEALAFAHERADVAIVSSANRGAVIDEWGLYGLLDSTDVICAQDSGSKAHCIAELLKKGYDKDCVLMCGDAPGDMDAAHKNGVLYFPILVKHEPESWELFVSVGFDRLIQGTYAGSYEQARIDAFISNLGGGN